EPAVELHPADLARRDLREGDLVVIESRRGKVIVPVSASTAVKPGMASLPMHWGGNVLAGRDGCGINAVSGKATCPISHQPELKHAAVRISRCALPWQVVAFGYPD